MSMVCAYLREYRQNCGSITTAVVCAFREVDCRGPEADFYLLFLVLPGFLDGRKHCGESVPGGSSPPEKHALLWNWEVEHRLQGAVYRTGVFCQRNVGLFSAMLFTTIPQ